MVSERFKNRNVIMDTLKVCLGLLISGIGTAFMYEAGMGSAPASTITEGIEIGRASCRERV